MLTVLFWNVNRRPCASYCANLARSHDVDVLVLAECLNPQAFTRALNRGGTRGKYFPLPFSGTTRIVLFSKFVQPDMVELESDTRYRVHRLAGSHVPELLVVSVHALSGLRVTETEQDEELRRLARRVHEIEDARGHSRTLLIGDLNAQPFDRRVSSASGLHAVLSRRVAEEESRRVSGTDYRYFYNPMWQFFGNRHPEPQGTYFYRKAEHDVYFWYAFDQVLLRPALLPYFADADVAVVTTDGAGTSFQKASGAPDKELASDHFPILLRLSYPGV